MRTFKNKNCKWRHIYDLCLFVSKFTRSYCFQIYPFTGKFSILIFLKSCEIFLRLNVPYFHFPAYHCAHRSVHFSTVIREASLNSGFRLPQTSTADLGLPHRRLQNSPGYLPNTSLLLRLKDCKKGWKNRKS